MKKSVITLLLAAVSVVSCEPPMPPSDEEMIRHFATHEAAFRKVYEIMSESSEGSFHYPPLSPEEVIILDSTEQSDTYVSLVMPYYSHGIVDAGTSKSFVYDPGLESRRNIRITEHGDLNEIYRRTYNDTTLYKPVKEGWYIKLDHSR